MAQAHTEDCKAHRAASRAPFALACDCPLAPTERVLHRNVIGTGEERDDELARIDEVLHGLGVLDAEGRIAPGNTVRIIERETVDGRICGIHSDISHEEEMKKGLYVDGLSNIQRFYGGVKAVENRGAPEASWLLAEGEAGYGKSKTLGTYAFKRKLPFVRAKSDWTPSWMLKDIAHALDLTPTTSRTAGLFDIVSQELMVRQRDADFAVVVDEINHAARSLRVLETLRDLTDGCEVVLIAGGTKDAYGEMRRYQQIRSRICEIVTFGPADLDDIHKIVEKLTDWKLKKDLAELVEQRTGGRIRLVMNAIAAIDAVASRSRWTSAGLEDWGNRRLLKDDRTLPVETANG